MKWNKFWLDDKSGFWEECKLNKNIKAIRDIAFNYFFVEIQTLDEKGKKRSWEIIHVFKTNKKLEEWMQQNFMMKK